jgi:hypothetical protein
LFPSPTYLPSQQIKCICARLFRSKVCATPIFCRERQRSEVRGLRSEVRGQTSDFRHPISDFQLPTSDFRHPISDFRHPTSDFPFQRVFLIKNRLCYACLLPRNNIKSEYIMLDFKGASLSNADQKPLPAGKEQLQRGAVYD